MRFEQSDDVPAGATLDTDICVIGSGAAGVTLARELDGSAHRVLVIEAGGSERNILRENELFAVDQLGTPQRNPIATRGRWYGGSTNLWFGRIALPTPIDFEERPWLPSTGWPLSYSELQPWLARAGVLLDVPHFEKLWLENWPLNSTIETFVNEGESTLQVFRWADGMFMGPFHRSALEASNNVRLLLETTAVELVANESSTALESLQVCGRFGNRFSIRASTYVLAGGGLENTRLLLASTRRSPAGVANDRDLVGRYYMDHPRGDGLARVDLKELSPDQVERLSLLGEKTRTEFGTSQFRLVFAPELQRREELLNHALHVHLTSEIHELPAFDSAKRLLAQISSRTLSSKAEITRDLRAAAAGSPNLLRLGLTRLATRGKPTNLFTIDQMEQAPDPDSRITVDWSKKDRWGLPRLQLDWRIGESTYRSQRRMHRLFRDILERNGIRTFRSSVLDRPDEVPALLDMKHPSGTTRMSENAATGVVDSKLRAHGIANLYITGTSTFPTVGHFNPTLVIVALAARLAAELRESAPRAH